MVGSTKFSTFALEIDSESVGNEEACQSDGLFLTVKTERATCSTSAKSSIIRSVNLTLEILLYPILTQRGVNDFATLLLCGKGAQRYKKYLK